MNVTVTITGDGQVSGAGVHSMGDEVTLTATPSSFSHFLLDSEVILDNPYVFIAPNTDVSISAVFIVTIESYLRASVGFEISDAALMKIRVDRSIALGTDVTTMTLEAKELAYADCLMYGVNSPSQVQGAKEGDFGWSHQAGSSTLSITDKRLMREQANAIYRKYGTEVIPTVKLMTLNGGKYYSDARY